MTKRIPLTQGFVALVDDEDYDDVMSAGRWHARRDKVTVYAGRDGKRADGSRMTLLLHAFITGFAITDHINGDGLDNRRVNLREATKRQNGANRRRHSNNTSGFKGVHWHKGSRKWAAQITVAGRHHNLGRFASAMDAALAYDAAALELHGEFAHLNFPLEVAK